MDLIYMSDAMAYQSIRGQFSYYDRSWEQKQSKKPQGKTERNQTNGGSEHGKEGCRICKEQRKRRTLQAYIRSKSNEQTRDSCRLNEDDEEEVDAR